MTGQHSTDRTQQIVVTVSYLACLVGSMIGVGVFGGTRIASAAGGALAPDATLLAPASAAFSVWTVVYAGLAGYTVLQWFPAPASADRQRRLRLPVAGTMLLNAAWILVVQAGWLWASVAVIGVLLALLSRVFVILVRTRPAGMLERVLVDGSLGLYFGWVCVATAANVAAALTASGFDGAGIDPDWWAVAVLAVVGAVGVVLAARSGGRIAVAVAIAWGLAWIAVARWDGAPQSGPTAVAAAATAVVVLGVAGALRLRAATRTVSAIP
ncbi:tryptophan-rich sensory protein [Promicromonospora iranensis]|uniref:Tryptophan-rich sensory protein n=1 Tax=Promicromonospora iranensis TaxID=1105144 RepID=A0ABU2CTW1_9MICO|nr:tryptophan-rich sensory protein [Promicromonospora iranensis]MDR7384778.1 tryptophan-rich sensory protein [Promicromonospora iranensis]